MAGRILGLALGLWAGLFGATGLVQAQQADPATPRLDQLRGAIKALDCTRPDLYVDLDFTLVLLSAYGGQPVVAQAEAAQINVKEYLLGGNSLDRAKGGAGYVERILAANPDAYARAMRDVAARGAALCPVLVLMDRRGLTQVVRQQETWRDYYQPHASLAQVGLAMHGCGVGAADGLFGDGSRAAWMRAGLRDLGPQGLPGPGDVVDVLEALGQGQACGPVRADLRPAARTALGCVLEARRDVTPLQAGWAAGAVRDPAGLRDVAGPVWSMCRAQFLKRPDRDYDSDVVPASQAEEFLRAVMVGLAASDAGQVQAQVQALGAVLAGPPEPEELDSFAPEKAVDPGHILAVAGADLFLGQNGMPVARELAGWVLLAHGLNDSRSAALRAGIGRGVLRDGVSEGLLAAIARTHQPSVRDKQAVPDGDPLELARGLLADGGPYGQPIAGYVSQADMFATAGGAWLDFGVDIEGISGLVALADAVQASPAASDLVRMQGTGAANAAVGVLLGEGNTRRGADPGLSLVHLRAAMEKGNPYGTYRMALAAETGLGRDAPDLAGAEALYRAAVDMGQPAAAMRLADWAVRGKLAASDAQVADWLRMGLGLVRGVQVKGAAAPLMQMMRHAPLAFEAGPLAGVMAELALFSASDNEGFRYGGANIALELARGYAGRVPGAVTDPERAAFWYRRAGADGQGPLARLLAVRPDLALSGTELAQMADGSLFALYLSAPGPGAFQQALATQCPADRPGYDCIAFLSEAALGALPGEGAGALLEPALIWLSQAAAAEAAQAGRPSAQWAYVPPDSGASWAYARVLAFYGDYDQARAVLAPIRRLRSYDNRSDVAVEITDAAFRRAVVRFIKGGDPAHWAPVADLLQDLASRGDEAAVQFLEMARAGAQAPALSGDLDQARAQFALAETYGATQGLAAAARRLSLLEEEAGQTARAATLELRAFGADLQRHALTELRLGALHATMGRVCSYSRSSERLFALDQPDVALVLAKQAVNELQGMRAQLRGLPEKLQMCFRDSVASHYRWLADLFIARDRPAEATAVLSMLKSFETFEFLGRDEKYRGISLDQLPLTGQEQDLLVQVQDQDLSVTAQSLERRALLLARRDGGLSPEQDNRLEVLNAALAQARTAREAQLASLAQAAHEADRAARVQALDSSKSVKALLRRAYGGTAAALHYVVLPDRMGAVLTTGHSERVFTWDRLGDAPFDEAALNARVQALRAVLRDPARDPLPAAQQMMDLLLPAPLRAELRDAKVQTLIVSADRQLRYVPFAALYDGERFLIEQYDITNVTEAPGAGGADLTGVSEMAGFGTTRAWHGFSPLPGVQQELQSLMGAGALFAGAPQLDGAFTRDRLAQSLVFADGAGIVHLASHFKLSDTEAGSFLLLGDGGQLSIRDIKEGLGMDLDFTEVALLTLSACETGFGGAQADGRELESFAAIAQQEGAASVVATLWPVADRSTARFMGLFYGAIARDGMAPRVALSAAQRAFLAGSDAVVPPDPDRSGKPLRARAGVSSLGARHPFYWAPFVSMEGSA